MAPPSILIELLNQQVKGSIPSALTIFSITYEIDVLGVPYLSRLHTIPCCCVLIKRRARDLKFRMLVLMAVFTSRWPIVFITAAKFPVLVRIRVT